MNIKHSLTIAAERPDDFLTVGDLREALLSAQVPHNAQVAPIMRERGTQRDPYTVLVGLTVTWTTGGTQ